MLIEILKVFGLVLMINPIFTYFLIILIIGYLWSKVERANGKKD